jgi:arylsulfatase
VLSATCSACSTDSPRLLLLVTVDTLRADHLGAYGSDRGLTPHLDALAAESLVFTAAYAPVSHTLPSMTALLTGRYPQEFGVTSNLSVLPAATPTLASAFRDAGWNTAAVVSNWVLRRASGLDQGFDDFDEALPQLESTRPMPERLGGDTTDAALRALDTCLPQPDSRCLLWVHYQDPHGPYTPPEERRQRHLAREQARPDGAQLLPLLDDSFGIGGIPDYQYLEGRREVAFYRAGYDGEIDYLDEEVGRLLDGLAQRELSGRSVIVFASDHGESLGENDYWFGHGEFLSEDQVHVPLLIRAPGHPIGERSDVACLVDLLPTLADLLLEVAPQASRPGRALLAAGAEQQASSPYLATLQGSGVPRVGIVEGDFKYVMTLRDKSVWDGRLTARGQDEVDLTMPAPQVASSLRTRIEELMRHHQPAAEQRRELSGEDRAHLEALGYVEREVRPAPPSP